MLDVRKATIEDLRGHCGDDKGRARGVIARLASALAEPGADISSLRAKMSVMRAALMPASELSRFDGDDKAFILFSDPGSKWSQVGEHFFRKEIIHAGTWVHPSDGSTQEFPPARLSRIAQESNRFLDATGRAPFPDGHKYDSKSNMGWWHAWEFDKREDIFFGLLEVPSDEIAGRIGKDIRDVSMTLLAREVDSYGREYHDVIIHACATPYPVIDGQRNFEPVEVSLSRGGPPARVYVPSAYAAERAKKSEESSMTISEKAMVALGLNKDAKPEEIEAAILSKLGGGGKPAAGPAPSPAPAPAPAPAVPPPADAALSRALGEVETLKSEMSRLKANEAKADGAALDKLIHDTKAAVAKGGAPTAFSADREAKARAMWATDKDAAREFAAACVEASVGIATMAPGHAPAPDAKELASKAEADRNKAETELALYGHSGYAIERAADGKTATAKPVGFSRDAKPVVIKIG
jgi:hypothetical protein